METGYLYLLLILDNSNYNKIFFLIRIQFEKKNFFKREKKDDNEIFFIFLIVLIFFSYRLLQKFFCFFVYKFVSSSLTGSQQRTWEATTVENDEIKENLDKYMYNLVLILKSAFGNL